MKRLVKSIAVVAAAGCLVFASPQFADAFDLGELAQRYVDGGSLPKQQTGPIGYYTGPTAWPSTGPVGGPAGMHSPGGRASQEEAVAELLIMLVGHACNDLQRGAQLFSEDASDKNANFLRYTALKVIESLELDARDGTLAPVLQAVDQRDPRGIEQAVAAMRQEVETGIASDLGAQYQWYFEAGANISRIEFSIWEETHYNLLSFFAKGVDPRVSFQFPPAAGAEDLAGLIQQVQTAADQDADVVTLLEGYFAVRDYITQVYQFEGSGLVLW